MRPPNKDELSRWLELQHGFHVHKYASGTTFRWALVWHKGRLCGTDNCWRPASD